ncbi:ATP-dependent helicase [Persicirhabdus sediminis]|uniref:DNA 3'-5' helicase n=1 Tax=Persicirhabdus sediminis TaxID=454144 RepID=A0A8J7SKP7_9BACT|nr:UvrD-helicase domain-containing protein [Persicirhabdus sediminis]MBK1791861.1 UvrD-helicase domain-containing protein [Persicirhabdus sediminis]
MARDYQMNRSTPLANASGINYAAELNEQQLLAVTSRPGPALVIAGAGSGKTRTLTHRVAYLLDQGAQPGSILLLTFTNKAAREMMERVSQLVPQDLSALWTGTFHSIGSRILRRHADELGFTRSFSILDRDDQKAMLKTVLADLKIEVKGKGFPKPDLLATMFSMVVNTEVSLDDIIEESYEYFAHKLEDIRQVQLGYEAKKLATNSMDFDDLLVRTLNLLQDNEELRGLYQRKFKHVLVDEYQDTNSVQSKLINLLVSKHKSLMVVGDDAQSIYSWRGADMRNILAFEEHYPDAKVYKIETNYRSVPEILEISNAAIRANTEQYEKELRAVREGGQMTPALVPIENTSMQAQFVCERIQDLIDGDGIKPNEIAVLYRAHYQSMELQMELAHRGFQFEITSGLRFFEQAHVKDVAAYIRFVCNLKDEVSFQRMVLMLPGVGAKTAERLWRDWAATEFAVRDKLPASFSELLLKFKVPAKAKSDWEQMAYILDELAPAGKLASPSQMIYAVFEGSYDEYLKATFDNYDSRRKDIETLMEYSEKFEDVVDFLSQLSLMSSVDGDPAQQKQQNQKDEPAILLSSIHQAKGLEWKVVFLIGLADGMFPTGRVLDAGDNESFEEERRLFYVALTRAKDQIYMVYPMTNPRSYTGDYVLSPSRFIDDIPEEMLEEWNVSVW